MKTPTEANQENYLYVINNTLNQDVIDWNDKDSPSFVFVRFRNSPKEYKYRKCPQIYKLEKEREYDGSKYQFFLISEADGRKGPQSVKKAEYFSSPSSSLYKVYFSKGFINYYAPQQIAIILNTLTDGSCNHLIQYYKAIADTIGLKDDDGNLLLHYNYEALDFVGEDTVLSLFLKRSGNGHPSLECKKDDHAILYPFGCNLSQMHAVDQALSHRLSIIQGPPGTGKTQTILSLTSNLLARNYSVAVVSNNNASTANVAEKMQSRGYLFTTATLGRRVNKELFISQGQTAIPDALSQKKLPSSNAMAKEKAIVNTESKLKSLFMMRNDLAECEAQLEALLAERGRFEPSRTTPSRILKKTKRLSSKEILMLWTELQDRYDTKGKLSFFFKLNQVLFHHIRNLKAFKSIPALIITYQGLYYEKKELELQDKIKRMKYTLAQEDFENLQAVLQNDSSCLLDHSLAVYYKGRAPRRVFTADDLWKNARDVQAQYPVIFSTTFSLRNSLSRTTYDYVIVDESSQVDLVTGVLAMSVARNMVVVGDLMQLPNVISNPDKAVATIISEKMDIHPEFRFENNCLLSSLARVFPEAPKTMLREHYRCHPKIIGFCNEKFYDNQLIIMTKDHGEKDVLEVTMTAKGNHARKHVNQRQIDEIREHILPSLKEGNASLDCGIIAPYNNQVNEIASQIFGVEVATVHKFQGREKDSIIISTVDNQSNDFTNNPNLLNVAVSRAKQRLRLVVSDEEAQSNSNIGDLVRYIRYHGTVSEPTVHSVFDLLYADYERARKVFLSNHKRVSEYDSENLMYAEIESVLKESHHEAIGITVHQPLSALFSRQLNLLTKQERHYVTDTPSHVDFMLFRKIDRSPLLAIEVDGYAYHKKNSKQAARDQMKNAIFAKTDFPLLRLSTTGSQEKEKIEKALDGVLEKS